MSKGPDAFRTISEVAEELDIPQHVLRFWETRFPAIRPLKRGGGRRYYRPDDVDLLRGIRHLLYGQGYTIRGVQRILKEAGPRSVQGVGRGETTALPAPEAGEDDLGDEMPAGLLGDNDLFGAEGSPASPMMGRPPEGADFAPGLSDSNRELLHSVLDELLECQRALEGLRRS